MFKLVAVGGKIRGQEFILEQGENLLGRDPACRIQVEVEGVSKKHCSLTVTSDSVYIEDLGSSNGTLVNGVLAKRMTLKNGDKIVIPNVIFQLVSVTEKKVIIKKAMDSSQADEITEGEEWFKIHDRKPEGPIAKGIWFFKYKAMPFLHGLNEEYDWKIMVGVLLSIFVLAVVSLTILPVINFGREVLMKEATIRGVHYADDIVKMNSDALAKKEFHNVSTEFLQGEDGVISYELFDMEGRIVKPDSKQNSYTNDTFSLKAKNWLEQNKDKGIEQFAAMLSGNEIGVGRLIYARDKKYGQSLPVGIITIRFAPTTLAIAAKMNIPAFLQALGTSAIIAVIFFAIIYFLMERPIRELYLKTEDALRGKRKLVDSKLQLSEINSVRDSINSMVQKIRETQGQDALQFKEVEEDGPYVRTVGEFLAGAQGPALALNSEKMIMRMNMKSEDLLGFRENTSSGKGLLDVAREKGFAATVTDLCDQSANSGGASQSGRYELGGKSHEIHVVSLMGRDGFAKAFYITFMAEE